MIPSQLRATSSNCIGLQRAAAALLCGGRLGYHTLRTQTFRSPSLFQRCLSPQSITPNTKPTPSSLRSWTLRPLRGLSTGKIVLKPTSAAALSTIEDTTKHVGITPTAQLSAGGDTVQVLFEDGAKSEYHNIWLRDHCRCPQCFHPKTKQRLVPSHAIPLNIRPISFTVTPTTSNSQAALHVTWPPIEGVEVSPHASTYSLSWLGDHSYYPVIRRPESRQPRKRTLWGAELSQRIDAGDLSTPYEEVMKSEAGLAPWLRHIAEFGIGFVDGVPATMEDTEKVARRIAHLRETHYGGFWSFEADMSHGDLAYSTVRLGAHNDTTYFTDPVGLQMWHQLLHTGTGGASLYVDGFHCASKLLTTDPQAYDTLSRIPIRAHAAGDPHVLVYTEHPTAGFPILNHDPTTGALHRVRYNSDDRSALDCLAPSDVPEFYRALQAWHAIISSEKNECWTQLRPGRLVVIDNTRVMHGRAAFVGRRVMCGAYIGVDDFWSRVRTVAEGGRARDEAI
ncbi:Trimethyllysine dioxygenase [Gonapodya prolifera JEL478]|uniref:trimethyllysine dioxygenase n=1 Tax=Gonapodya prolifera (strain JEL478) TaxID=1344416 RepID=A0A139B0A5_GONPJ|nr:Trimethyllysine dioxygenase [Gonapodya prolifera JEL478]|eukprot:KXS22428.1 Trimethyllysine dioxygenase [Gonapodya prolifera JEL478]